MSVRQFVSQLPNSAEYNDHTCSIFILYPALFQALASRAKKKLNVIYKREKPIGIGLPIGNDSENFPVYTTENTPAKTFLGLLQACKRYKAKLFTDILNDPNFVDKSGCSGAKVSMMFGNFRVFEQLVEKMTLDEINDCWQWASGYSMDCVKILVAKVDAITIDRVKQAIRLNRVDILEYLLTSGKYNMANVDDRGQTILHYAIDYRRNVAVQIILRNKFFAHNKIFSFPGKTIHRQNQTVITPLELARKKNNPTAIAHIQASLGISHEKTQTETPFVGSYKKSYLTTRVLDSPPKTKNNRIQASQSSRSLELFENDGYI